MLQNKFNPYLHHFKRISEKIGRGKMIIYFYSSIFFLINFAGFPATILLSGTSFVTTLPAPTIEFSPIVTPGSIVDEIPIHAFFLIWIGFAMVPLLFSGLKS